MYCVVLHSVDCCIVVCVMCCVLCHVLFVALQLSCNAAVEFCKVAAACYWHQISQMGGNCFLFPSTVQSSFTSSSSTHPICTLPMNLWRTICVCICGYTAEEIFAEPQRNICGRCAEIFLTPRRNLQLIATNISLSGRCSIHTLNYSILILIL